MTKKDKETAEKNLSKQIFGDAKITKPEIVLSRHPADGKETRAANHKDYGKE